MTTSWHTAPVVEKRKQTQNTSAASSQRRLMAYATAVRAQNIALASQINPTLSAEVIVGADAVGLTAEDPMMQQLAQLEQDQSGFFGSIANVFDEAVWDPVKGATKWIGMGFQGLYDELLVRQSRVAANMVSQGYDDYGEAYEASGDQAFGAFGASVAGTIDAVQAGDWKAALGLEGQALNMGEGIFAGSDLSMEVEQELGFTAEISNTIGTNNDQVTNDWGYQNYGANFAKLSVNQRKMMYLSGRNNEIMQEASDPNTNLGATQAAFGDPYTERIRAEEESVLWYQDSIPWNKGESGLGTFTQLSPGRVLSSFLVEPGTDPFHWMSGTIDAGMQIFGDPADIGLGAGVRAAKGARALGLADEGIRLAMDNQRILGESQEALKTLESSEDYLSGLGKSEVTQQRAAKLGRSQFPVEGTGKSVERAQGMQRYGRAQDEADKLRESIRTMQQEPDLSAAVKRSAGVLDGSPRKTVSPLETTQFLTGRTAVPFVENFVRAKTLEEVDALLSHVKTAIPRKMRSSLAAADNNADVIGLLLPHVGGALTETGLALVPSLTGGLFKSPTAMIARGMANINPLVDARKAQYFANNGSRVNSKLLYGGSALSRRFSQVAPATLDLNDLDRSYDGLTGLGKNLDLGRQTELAYEVNGVTKTDTFDSIMGRWTEVADGDFVGAYDVLTDYMAYAFTSLSEGGLSPNVAHAITRFTGGTKDDALWFTNRVGDIVREPNAATKVVANGQEIVNPGPQLITELFNGNIMLPDHNLIRRAVAETDKLGRITNDIALKGVMPGKTRAAVADFDQRWMIKAADNVLTNVWKPLVLLRFAWPFRVVGEEQGRMSASGLGSMFSFAPGAGHHPLSYIAMAMSKTSDEAATLVPKAVREKIVGGRTLDVLGDDITQAEDFLSSMSKRANFDGELGAKGSPYWTTVNKFAPDGTINPGYMDGLTTELNQLWSDPVVQKMFADASDDLGVLTDQARISQMVDWMRTSDGNHWLRELTRTAPKEYRDILKTDDGLRNYLEGVYARAHLKAGGEYRYILEDGSFITDAGTMGKMNDAERAAWSGQSGYEIVRPGHQSILDAYSTGKFNGIDIRKSLGNVGEKGTTDFKVVRQQLSELLDAEDMTSPRFPQTMKSNKFMQDDVTELGQTYDKALNRMFEWFMTRPTNRLSRSPAFRDSYWQRMGDLMPYMDDATQEAARAGAGKAKMGTVAEGWGVSKRGATRKAAGRGVEGGTITSLDEADRLAKAYALTEVEDLLYDLSKKHNVSEAMSVMMPFVEAYGEVTSTWAKLMTQQWGRPFRRFQQVIESGRESDPFDEETGFTSVGQNKGFFHEDEYGNEVFTGSLPVPGVIGSGQFNYSLEGLNFISSIIPGFGPAVQVPANLFMPKGPEWQPIRDMISPFGGDEGNLLSSSLPAYMKRALNAFDSTRSLVGSEQDQDMFNNAVIDVLRAKALEDPAEYKRREADPAENAAMLQEAKNEARNLYLVRAFATALGPTSPSFEPLAEDKDGRLWAYNALGSQYYKLKEAAGGDDLMATQQFVALFGIEPAVLQEGKTTQIIPRSTIKAGAGFEQQNQALFREYPSTAFFLGPALYEDVGEFDYQAYFRQKIAGTRVSRSPEEWQRQVNDFYGELAFSEKKLQVFAAAGVGEEAGMGALPDEMSAYLRNYQVELQQQFPGYVYEYGVGVTGQAERVDTSTQIAEVTKMVQNPELRSEYEAVRGAASYMKSRETVLQLARGLGFATLESSETDEAEKLRAFLRLKGSEATELYPEFGPMWDSVFSYEVQSKQTLDPDMAIAEVVGGT